MLRTSIGRYAAVSIVGASIVEGDTRRYRHAGRRPSPKTRTRLLHCENPPPRIGISRAGLLSQSKALQVGDIYDMQGNLGEGGFGSVRVGVHKLTGVKRAVKAIPKRHTSSEEFENEVKALQALDHPNIIKMIEYFQDDSNYYLVQELCTGPDLVDVIDKSAGSKVPERDASIMMRQCIKSVIGCHVHGFIHRDIKLDNFMITSQDMNIKLIDFGLAARCSGKGTATGLAGTELYMAPEMISADGGRYGKSVDVWSLGVVLFQMLTGEFLIDVDEEKIRIGSFYDVSAPDIKSDTVKVLAKNPDGTFEVEGRSKLHNIEQRYLTVNRSAEIERIISDMQHIERRIRVSCAALKRQGVSEDAIDLIRKMLCYDPKKRITTSGALRHPFIMRYFHDSLDGEVGKGDKYDYHDMALGEKLRRFVGLSRLQQIALLAMAHLAAEGTMGGKLIQLRHMFRRVDIDGDGELSLNELRQSFKDHGQEVPNDLKELFEACCDPTRGTMSYLEFIAIELSSEGVTEPLCTAAFMLLDQNFNGEIDEEDFVLLGHHTPDELLFEAELELRPKEQRKGVLSLEDFHILLRGVEAIKTVPPVMPKLLYDKALREYQ